MGEARETVGRIVAAFDAGDENGVRELLDPDVVMLAPGGARLTGREAAWSFTVAFMRAFADVTVAVHIEAEQADMVIEEYTMTATHTGPLTVAGRTVAPTSRRITIDVVEVYRVAAGRVVENRLYYDPIVLLRQLDEPTP
jgi:ketosteroid isomerase-like protein